MNSPLSPPDPGAAQSSQKADGTCTHARVQIVARDEDGEFVECLECREIFEASEFRDMDAEDRNRKGAA